MFEYKIDAINKVVDGDTVDLGIDLGFHVSVTERFRLWGINAPELKGDTLVKAQETKNYVDSWLNSRVSDPGLFVSSYRDKDGTHDKYGRWIGDIYYVNEGIKYSLSDELVEKKLAIPFMDTGYYSQGGGFVKK